MIVREHIRSLSHRALPVPEPWLSAVAANQSVLLLVVVALLPEAVADIVKNILRFNKEPLLVLPLALRKATHR
jgi:hypothetical protein